MKYARIDENGFVVETFVEPEGFTIDQCFHPSIAEQFVTVPSNTLAGWVKQSDGSFMAPKPYPSWIMDSQGVWQAPTDKPTDGKAYYWDEPTTNWIEVTSNV